MAMLFIYLFLLSAPGIFEMSLHYLVILKDLYRYIYIEFLRIMFCEGLRFGPGKGKIIDR